MSESGTVLLAIAREAIGAHLAGEPPTPPCGPPSQPLFVTLWEARQGRRLRGCVGRMLPQHDDLFGEVASCAVAAATQDPRFDPVLLSELDRLVVEISILGAEEPVKGEADLDPLRYGVIARQGGRAGVLLPGVVGVTSGREQLALALRKGCIDPVRPYALARFAVEKLREAPGAPREVV